MWAAAFFGGGILGGILAVISYNIPRMRFIFSPISDSKRCGHIDRQKVPIFSRLLSLGSCLDCNGKKSERNLMIELISALGILFIYISSSTSIQFAARSLFFCFLMLQAVIDIERMILPDSINLSGVLTGCFLAAVGWSKLSFWSVSAGVALGLAAGLLIYIVSKGGMGMGDAKFMALIGSHLGPLGSLQSLYWGSLLGAITMLALIYAGKWQKRVPFPFAPFLALGAMIVDFIHR
jgi:prepilin signal peptidase PulO-like enzyme (type II secretory pathway)